MDGLAQLDPWGEWRNPHEHPDVVAFLLRERPSYAESVGYIRAARPREDPHEAARWWASPEARGHFINALLRRGGTMGAVEREMDLAKWKLHHYLERFGLRFWPRPKRGAKIILPSGEVVDGVMQEVLEGTPVRAYLETEEGWWLGEWSPASWAFRAVAPVPPTRAGWRRLLYHRFLLSYAQEAAGLYLDPEGYSQLWQAKGGTT